MYPTVNIRTQEGVALDTFNGFRGRQTVIISCFYTEEKSNTIAPERSPLKQYYK
jgi:hypothetical protein